MMLLTRENRRHLPPLRAQDGQGDDAIAYVKFFDPTGQWTWYATEFDGTDEFFGLVDGFEVEWGYFTLEELSAIRGRFGLGIERDRHFTPTTIREIKKRLAARRPEGMRS